MLGMDVHFGKTFVTEKVRQFFVLRRHTGEEFNITADVCGDLISVHNTLGMEACEDLTEEERQSIVSLSHTE